LKRRSVREETLKAVEPELERIKSNHNNDMFTLEEEMREKGEEWRRRERGESERRVEEEVNSLKQRYSHQREVKREGAAREIQKAQLAHRRLLDELKRENEEEIGKIREEGEIGVNSFYFNYFSLKSFLSFF